MAIHKYFLFPGWMSKARKYGLDDGVDIWERFIDPRERLEAEYLVGHSLGCHFALLNWQANKNTKLVLVNPPVFKRPAIIWLFRWLRYLLSEGPGVSFKDLKAAEIFPGIRNCFKLMSRDYSEIIRQAPRENLTIIKGERDNFFCDREVVEFARKENIRLIEIKGSGHNWSGEIREEVLKIINRETNVA